MIGSMFKVCFRAIFAMSFCVFAACGGNEAAQKSGDTAAVSGETAADNKTNEKKSAEGLSAKADDNADGFVNGHGYVELGLPSGTKWATRNVGASAAEECGEYFAWGETVGKATYAAENSKTLGNSDFDREIGGDKDVDCAAATWGGTWGLPTVAQVKELLDNCNVAWSEHNGVKGIKATSKKNGRWIFLPAAGTKGSVGNANFVGVLGHYWCGTPYSDNSFSAYNLYFKEEETQVNWDLRRYGNSVRPVTK